MKYKDYYAELGVAQHATPAEIRKAYRDLAKRYHPDTSKGDSESGNRFRAINEAHEVLSDPVKRQKYDEFGADWKRFEDSGAQPGGFDWSKYGGGRAGEAQRESASSFDQPTMDPGVEDLFGMLFGQLGDQRRTRRGTARKGADLQTETVITLEEAYHGTARLIELAGQRSR